MKKTKIIYWTTTGIFSMMMLFSAYNYFTNPDVVAGFTHLGYPSYFRVELGIAKIIGALILVLPMIPTRIKEWAYAGFGITLVSAFIAHAYNGDGTQAMLMPLVFLVLLIISNSYLHRQEHAQRRTANILHTA